MTLSIASEIKKIEISKVTYGDWSPILEFSIFLNEAPIKPELVAPAMDALNQSQTPNFTWNVSSDTENDKLDFHIQIDTSSDFNSQGNAPIMEEESLNSYENFSFNAPVSSVPSVVSYQTVTGLLDRTVYYWRIRAHDGTRYGDWSEPLSFTVGVVATKILLATNQTYLPVAGITTEITATYLDALDNIDVDFEGSATFVQTQGQMGTLHPIMAPIESGIAKTVYTSTGALGATSVEIVTGLEHNKILLFSTDIVNIPALISPVYGIRLASLTKPHLVWTVPDNTLHTDMHFKVEIYKSSILNPLHLVYVVESKEDTTGFSYTAPVSPFSADVWHDVQNELPDGKYWWRIIPWDGTKYETPSQTSTFSLPNEMTIVSNPLLSIKPVTQVVAMANTSIDIGTEKKPAEVKHYVTNMALEPENEIIWHDVTEHVIKKTKFRFNKAIIPAHGWAVAIKTCIKANDAIGQVSFNGHGVVFDGDYSETSNEDFIGVISSLTPIAFQALPAVDGSELTLSWAYVDLNSDNRRIIDKFIIEFYNPNTGLYEPYDGDKGEIIA